LLEAFIFSAMGVEAALFIALMPAVGHFFVPVGAGDLGVGCWARGGLFGEVVVVGLGVGLEVEAAELGGHFFGGPGGFGRTFAFGGGILFLEAFELAEESQVCVAEVTFVARIGEEGVGGGIFVEGFGEGEAGRVVGSLREGVELGLGVIGALETPEDGGELVEEVELDWVGGVEGFFEFFDEDVVGGGAFVGEARGLGAEAVFEGVLGGFVFALRGFWAGGFLGVAAVGGEFAGGESFVMRAARTLAAIGFGDGGLAFFDQCDAHESPTFEFWFPFCFPVLVRWEKGICSHEKLKYIRYHWFGWGILE